MPFNPADTGNNSQNGNPAEAENNISENNPAVNAEQNGPSLDETLKKIEFAEKLVDEENEIIDEFSEFFSVQNDELKNENPEESLENDNPEESLEDKDLEDFIENDILKDFTEDEPEIKTDSTVINEDNPKVQEENPVINEENPIAQDVPQEKKEENPENSEEKIDSPDFTVETSEAKYYGAEADIFDSDGYAENGETGNTGGKNGKKDGEKNAPAKNKPDFSMRPSLWENILLFLGLASPELKRKNEAYKEQMRRNYEENKKAEEKENEADAAEEKKEKNVSTHPETEAPVSSQPAASEERTAKDLRESIMAQIKKSEELARSYPDNSTMAVILNANVHKLSEVHEMMLYGEMANKEELDKIIGEAAVGVTIANLMNSKAEKSPEFKAVLAAPVKDTEKVKKDFEETLAHPAVRNAVGKNPVMTLDQVLSGKKDLSQFTMSLTGSVADFKENGSKVVDENTFGALRKNPDGKWEKFPGVDEKAVSKSIGHLKTLNDDPKLFKSAAEMNKNNPPVSANVQEGYFKDRLADIEKVIFSCDKKSPNDIAVEKIARITYDNFTELQKTGMPDKGSENYEAQKTAFRKAAGSLFALEHFISDQNPDVVNAINKNPAKADDYIRMHTNRGILAGMTKSYGEKFTYSVLTSSINNSEYYETIMKEFENRKAKGIPENAEVFGSLYRNGPHDSWQPVKGATEEQVNNTYLELLRDNAISRNMIAAVKNAEIAAEHFAKLGKENPLSEAEIKQVENEVNKTEIKNEPVKQNSVPVSQTI